MLLQKAVHSLRIRNNIGAELLIAPDVLDLKQRDGWIRDARRTPLKRDPTDPMSAGLLL
jgi:hypothetical protein